MLTPKQSPLSKEAVFIGSVGLAILVAIAAMVIIGLRNHENPMHGTAHTAAENMPEVRMSAKEHGGADPPEETEDAPPPSGTVRE